MDKPIDKPEEKQDIAIRNDTALAMQQAEALGLSYLKPFSRRILVLNTYVAGVHHVRGIHSRIKKLKEGDPLLLLRETKNEYDELAILVQNAEGKKLGYIPRAKNEVLARLMDAGKCFEAEVVSAVDQAKTNRNVFQAVQIWINVYLVE